MRQSTSITGYPSVHRSVSWPVMLSLKLQKTAKFTRNHRFLCQGASIQGAGSINQAINHSKHTRRTYWPVLEKIFHAQPGFGFKKRKWIFLPPPPPPPLFRCASHLYKRVCPSVGPSVRGSTAPFSGGTTRSKVTLLWVSHWFGINHDTPNRNQPV